MEEKLKKIMASVFEVSETDITENSSPDSLEKWDSLRQLNLVSALEEEFEVEFEDDEIAEMISYKLVRLILKEKFEG
jgi:acyl carrier protein